MPIINTIKLKKLMEKKGLTPVELSKKSRVSTAVIWRMMRAEGGGYRTDGPVCVKLAAALNLKDVSPLILPKEGEKNNER